MTTKGPLLKRDALPAVISLTAVLTLAALLRLWNLEATEFKFDEARVCSLAAQFVDSGVPPVRGMGSSIGVDNPPLAIYLMSLPVLLSRDPLVATAYVALLNVAAVGGCYWLGRRYWGPQVGGISAVLLAASPWAVFYSRKVWAQDLLLPWVILFFAFLLAWVVEDRHWALSGAILTLAALSQIHLAALAFAPLLVCVILVRSIARLRRREAPWPWKPLLVGLGASALLYTPYLVFDALHGWNNARALLAVTQAPAQWRWEAMRFALLNVGGREIHALAGAERFGEFLDGIINLAYWPDRIEEGLVVVSAGYLLLRWWQRRRDRCRFGRDGVLLLWLSVPVLSYLRSSSPVYPHYLIPLYPAPYLALAIAAVDAIGAIALPRGRRLARALGALLLVALIGWQSYLSLSIHDFVDRHETPGGMGTPIRVYRQVLQRIAKYAQEWDNRQVIVLCPGDDPRIDECPAVYDFIAGRAYDLRLVDGNASLLFPQREGDTLIVLAPGESIAAVELPRHAQELPEERVPLREGVGSVRFYRLAAEYVPQPPVEPAGAPAHLANGVSLLGYELSGPLRPDETVRLALYWRIDALPADPPAQGYSFANHLFDADGQRCGQKDGPGHRVGLWRAGDSVVSWFDITLSAEAGPPPYHLRIGMYVHTPPDQFVTIPVLDLAGQPAAQAVEWLTLQ